MRFLQRFIAVIFAVGSAVQAPGAAGQTTEAAGVSRRPGADEQAAAFFSGQVQEFAVTIGPREMESLRSEARTPVAALVRVGGVTYESVAVHVKGSAGSRRGVDENPALTLNFGKLKPGQSFHGLKKIHLNNSVQDGGRMNEMIASELYRRAGIPTTRVTHAFVTVNGSDQGLYVVKEGFDKLWLRRNFSDASGNLYDGGFLQDVDNDLERDEGTGPDDHRDLRSLAEAAFVNEVKARRAALGKWLDLDQFTTFCALQNLLGDWDGYVYNHNNYRIYHEPRAGRFTFIPHGMDQLFGDVGFRLDRGMSGLVARQVWELPGQRDRMYTRVEALLSNVFTTNVVFQVLADAEARLRPALVGRRSGAAGQILAGMREVVDRAVARRENVRHQMVSRPQPLKFNSEGVATLAGWSPRVDGKLATANAGPAPDQTRSLILEAAAEGASGSWRRRLRLPAGSYEFEARLWSEGIKARTDGQGRGAGLRISGRSRTNVLAQVNSWTRISEGFRLESDREVELLVELRADAGRLWVALESLRLRRKLGNHE